jgi:hypothetical protein
MIGPILAANVLGYLAGFRIHWYTVSEPRVVVVTLAAILGCVMLMILFCVLADWRGFTRVPHRTTVFRSPFGIWWAILAVITFSPYDARWAQDVLVQLGRTAPVGLPALITAAAAVLIALYWAVEKVFREPDFADKPKVSQADPFA